MTDELAEELAQIKADTEAEEAEIREIIDANTKIKVSCELPSGTTFKTSFSKPKEWSESYDFVTLLDHFEVEAQEVDELVGKKVPIESSEGRSGLKFDIDREELFDRTVTTTTPDL